METATAKHTPGPWKWSRLVSPMEPRRYQSIYVELENSDDPSKIGDCVEVAVVTLNVGDRKQAQANARLIAAAPALLAACESTLAWLESENATQHPEAVTLRTAIAAARGSVKP